MKYEFFIILRPEIEEKEIEDFNTLLQKTVAELNGSFLETKNSFKQRLAYPVKRCAFGYQLLCYTELEPENIEKLMQKIKFEKNILRFEIAKQTQKDLERQEAENAKAAANAQKRREKAQEAAEKISVSADEDEIVEENIKQIREEAAEEPEQLPAEKEKEETKEEKTAKEKHKKSEKIKIEDLDKKLEEILDGEI